MLLGLLLELLLVLLLQLVLPVIRGVDQVASSFVSVFNGGSDSSPVHNSGSDLNVEIRDFGPEIELWAPKCYYDFSCSCCKFYPKIALCPQNSNFG
ncbi:hypothetical protein PR002_g12447 [Phytophthora rubi]|uniref:Uncharacterized protein n=1 Tax=Phytophthora rubi TaxID=129364 RepID=A0A6A3LRH3_9STRA|nr:hypothetical protein PR002_g12447 [Phytophthora rubi]